MLFNFKKKEILDRYGSMVTNELPRTNTIILLDTPEIIGTLAPSDMILTFDSEDNLVIQCERVFKKNFEEKDWLAISMMSYKYGTLVEDDRGIKSSVTYNVDYIDIIKYRKEWLDWADEYGQLR